MQLWAAVLALALIVGGSAPARAADPDSIRPLNVRIVEYGIYTAETKVPATGVNETMTSAKVANICHVMTTLTVPARDSLYFGLRFRVDGPPVGTMVEISRVIRFPDHTKPVDAPISYIWNDEVRRLRAGQISWTGWANWKSRPGIWTFRLLQADRKLAELSFTMVDKNDFSIRPDGDSTCFQMSGREGGTGWRSI